MRKLFLLIGLVIILVSLNWFQKLFAQDLNNLSVAEKAALRSALAEHRKDVTPSDAAESYQTPDLYGGSNDEATAAVTNNANDRRDDDHKAALKTFEQLEPFGMELFDDTHGRLPPNDIASDDAYILGPGDNLVIYLWGRVEKEYQVTIDREGKIVIPKVGEIVTWGIPLSEFKQRIKKSLSQVYSDFELSVSLGKIRSIRIYLTGEVERPGAYTVSSLTSLFNALYLAGGPTRNGSMRAIRLMRNGQVVTEVDLYKFLLEGDNSLDVRLESGDAIFVPVTGPRVSIRGQIRRPAIFELKGEETVTDLLRLAGGPTSEAFLGRAMLERVADNDEWEVQDLDLSEESSANALTERLADGDRLTLFSIFEAKKNIVAIFGQVKHPGYYERNDSTRISDLIDRAQLQQFDVHYDRANLFRRYSDWRTEVIPVNLHDLAANPDENLLLQDKDSLHIYSIEDVSWDRQVHIGGQVQRPGLYPYYDSMTVSDLVFLAGSFSRGASLMQGEIARTDPNGQVSIIHIDLTGPDGDTLRLQEDDRVYIRPIPRWRRHRTVSLDGEVQFPGEYVLRNDSESLYSLLNRAGGFTQSAFPDGIVLIRSSIGQNLERLKIRDQVERGNALIRDSLGNIVEEEQFRYDPESVNRIVVDVDKLIESHGSEGDVTLEPGDKIHVPQIPTGIPVLGEIGHAGTVKYREDTKVEYYVRRAGNFTARSDKKGTRLIKANGEAYSGGGTVGKKVELGDIIIVPTKVEKERHFMRSLTDVLTIATGALTTALLISKL